MSGVGPIEGFRPVGPSTGLDTGQQAEADDIRMDGEGAAAARAEAAALRALNQNKSRVASNRSFESRKETRDAKQEARERGKSGSTDSGDVARARQADLVRGNFGVAGAIAPHSPFYDRAATAPPSRDEGQPRPRGAADPIDTGVVARLTDGLSTFDSRAQASKEARKPSAPPPSAQTAAAQKAKAGAPPPPMPTVAKPKVAFMTPANPWNHIAQSFGYEDHAPAPLEEGGAGSSADQPHSTSNEYKIPA